MRVQRAEDLFSCRSGFDGKARESAYDQNIKMLSVLVRT
jgi:hypothetical protein